MANNIRCLTVHTLNKLLVSSSSPSIIDFHLSKLVKRTKEFLFHHPDILITKADKGNTTVTLDKNDYFNKMHNLLSDNDTYIGVTRDPTQQIITQLRVLLQR